ncbi:pre-piRNA 3'-exonuclease trimmer-like isoform X2 [Ceratina calcarata]|uniref:Pre-piRNA 3'-exonuclease trimmer-like isoform X2 n=1 Tax=Ceratina calcarata TaxID=156304 RepID=A0AAJ7WCR0_9HYME|nr:pre-piRNA 3'-exonuclease trimmer-like isoform X2 [Ceratina calcarata]
MNEVSEKDFKSLYPALKDAINDACFIAIDAEFTGISKDEDLKHSLFDTLDERYQNLKKNIEQYKIIQFGITLFRHSKENAYRADCYSFHLLQKPLPFKNRQLTFQLSALEFLCLHKFDFNKLISEGISCLDDADEEFLRTHIENGNLINDSELLSYEEKEDFKNCINMVSEWLSQNPEPEPLKLPAGTPILQYMMQKQLRDSIKNIWTTSGYKTVDVLRVPKEVRDHLEEEDNNRLEDELLDSYIGFSKVFKLLSACKKPFIGHNMLLDLMFIHQQFYKPLPDSYKQFKSNVHALFPRLYDTKYISFQFKKLFRRDEVYWKLNSLRALYEYFKSSGVQLSFNCPSIRSDKNLSGTETYHNAGFDSYCAGYIFIKMAHVFCVKKFGSGIECKPVTNTELMSAVKHLENCVNISRGNEMYMGRVDVDSLWWSGSGGVCQIRCS